MNRTLSGFALAVANRSLRLFDFDAEGAAQEACQKYNEDLADKHPDNQAEVLHVEDYIRRLEAAIVNLEGMYAAQKAHMKQLWAKDHPSA